VPGSFCAEQQVVGNVTREKAGAGNGKPGNGTAGEPGIGSWSLASRELKASD
jgi:hypothetical protein